MTTRLTHLSTMIAAMIVLIPAVTPVLAAEPMRVGERIVVAAQPPDARTPSAPKVAFDGAGTFLVVWQQGRDLYETETSDIYAARISTGPSSNGMQAAILDIKPLAVCTAQESQVNPAVGFANGVFVVAWSDLRNGKDFDIYAARVMPDPAKAGQDAVLDPNGVLVSGGPHNQYGPDIAAGNGNALIAWQDFRDNKGYMLCGARMSREGKILDGDGVLFGGKDKPIRGGTVAMTRCGNSWFMFWKTPEPGWQGAVARIEEKDGTLVVAESNARLPGYSACMGEPAADGARVFYAGTAIHGRGQEFRPCTVLMFDAAGCRPLPNPNPKVGANASGWKEDSMICAHIPMPGMDAPISIAHSDGIFLVVGRGATYGKSPAAKQLCAARIGADGSMIETPQEWKLIDKGSTPGLAGGNKGEFMLVYSAEERIFARRVAAK